MNRPMFSLLKPGVSSRKVVPYLFLLPTLILISSIVVYPMFLSIKTSFYSWPLMKPQRGIHFVGFGNYQEIFVNPLFWRACLITFLFVVGVVLTELILGMGLALFFNRDFRGKRIVRSCLLLPMMIAPVVTGLIWRYMFQHSFGIVNYLLSLFGVQGPAWLADRTTALPALMWVDVWMTTPFVFLVFLAGLQSLPPQIFEAAKIDGAGGIQTFLYISLPSLKSIILVVLVVRITDALRVFDIIYVMTQGGPAYATQTLQYLNYETAFHFFRMGSGAAQAVIIVLITIIFCIVFVRHLQYGIKE